MKAETGWGATAAVMALAAVVGVATQSGKPAQDAGSALAHGAATAAAVTEKKSAFERGQCVDLEGTIRTFLLASEKEIAAPASCYDGATPESDEHKANQIAATNFHTKAAGLQFVIAVLPDPLHTHFALSFDRQAEAIQQGAQDEDYFYDSSWMPWDTEEKSLVLLADQDKADDRKKAREEQPGVLLFRKRPQPGAPAAQQPYSEGLAVFVIGEEPTSGVHKRQFENAVAWIDALSATPEHPIKILGPSFSGSLPSLAQLLGEDDVRKVLSRRAANATDTPLSIYSGGITDNALVKWFAAPERGIGSIQFRSFQQDGDTLLTRYRTYLHQQGLNIANLAVISEDETAYGGYGASNLCQPLPFEDQQAGPTCLYYPRDLSALRNAYQKQGVFRVTSNSQSGDASQRQLSSDLADPEGKEHDTIQNFSGDQTALSQEAVLKQLVSSLRAHESQYLVLRSSNPLDQLFLSHFLKAAYPEGRVVIAGSDLLLRRENGAAALGGIMTLTTYPMLPWEYHWTVLAGKLSNLHDHRVFSQEGAEGTYFAARFLLHPIQCGPTGGASFLPPACVDLSVPGYAPPFWADPAGGYGSSDDGRRPAVWLSVLGRDGFWPVAALTDETLESCPSRLDSRPGDSASLRDGLWSLRQAVRASDAIHSLVHDIELTLDPLLSSSIPEGGRPQWPPAPLSLNVCLFAIFVWALFHLYCCAFPSLMAKPGCRAYFARAGGESHLVLIVMGSVFVALVPILLAWGYGAMSENGEPIPHALGWLYRTLMLVILALAGFAVFRNVRVESNIAPAPAGCEKEALDLWFAAPLEVWLAAALKASPVLARSVKRFPPLRKLILARPSWAPYIEAALPTAGYAAAAALFYCVVDFSLDEGLTDANRVPTYWRAIHLTTGVSPLVPLLAMAVGLYLWFWFSLQGAALFNRDRPLLPATEDLKITIGGSKLFSLRMFSQDEAGRAMEALCHPFAKGSGGWTRARILLLPLLAVLAAGFLLAGNGPIRSLGSRDASRFVSLGMVLCGTIILANVWQLMLVWHRLRQLLVFLDRLHLRRTMKAMKAYSWGSVWSMSGRVLDVRYKLLSRQMETLTHLDNSLSRCDSAEAGQLREQIALTNQARGRFAEWFSGNWDNWQERDLRTFQNVQASIARTCGVILSQLLVPEWRKEEASLLQTLPPEKKVDAKPEAKAEGEMGLSHPPNYILNAEELVCLTYMGFVQNVLGRMRTIVMQIILVYMAAAVAIATYPFDPRPALSSAMLVLFLILGIAIATVYGQMYRDSTLSLVTNTEPGELGTDFWIKLVGFSAGPVLGLLATVFPELTGSLFSWLQPGISSIK